MSTRGDKQPSANECAFSFDKSSEVKNGTDENEFLSLKKPLNDKLPSRRNARNDNVLLPVCPVGNGHVSSLLPSKLKLRNVVHCSTVSGEISLNEFAPRSNEDTPDDHTSSGISTNPRPRRSTLISLGFNGFSAFRGLGFMLTPSRAEVLLLIAARTTRRASFSVCCLSPPAPNAPVSVSPSSKPSGNLAFRSFNSSRVGPVTTAWRIERSGLPININERKLPQVPISGATNCKSFSEASIAARVVFKFDKLAGRAFSLFLDTSNVTKDVQPLPITSDKLPASLLDPKNNSFKTLKFPTQSGIFSRRFSRKSSRLKHAPAFWNPNGNVINLFLERSRSVMFGKSFEMTSGIISRALFERFRWTSCPHRAKDAGSFCRLQLFASSSAKFPQAPIKSGNRHMFLLWLHFSCARVSGSASGRSVKALCDTSRDRSGKFTRASPGSDWSWFRETSSFCKHVKFLMASGMEVM